MNMETLSNLLKLTSKDNPSLNNQIKMIETILEIKEKGMTNKNALTLLSEINPKLTPLVSLLNGLNEKNTQEKEDNFVQFNHF